MSGFLKLLYLFTGLLLKQTVDELKSLNEFQVEVLERRKEAIKEVKLPPAIMQGTPEAAKAMHRWQHQAHVAPEVAAISRKIWWRRRLPLAIYAATTLLCMAVIWYCETINPSRQ